MTAVFLDLDGTLLNSRAARVASMTHAFRSTGHGHHAEGDLTWMIGRPFVDSFAKLQISKPHPILDAYRVHYRTNGMYDAEVYPGVFDALEELRAQGHRLYLVTATPHFYATKVTAHFGLAPFMTDEFGPELDGTRKRKGELLAYALEQTGETAAASVVVGDRRQDMRAAAEVGMPSIAARWGYGEAEDWMGSATQIDHAQELPAAVLKTADLNPLNVTSYGTLADCIAEGHEIGEDERAQMDRALTENAVIVAETTVLSEDGA